MEWASNALDEWWNPPTPEDLVRRARIRVRRKCLDIERRIEAEEAKEKAHAKRLHKDAIAGVPREKLEAIAHALVGSQNALKKLRNIQSSMNALTTHMEAVDSSVAVREVMQVAADAIASVGVGNARAMAEDSRAIYTQLAQLQAMEEAAADAIGDDENATVAEDLVADIMDKVASSSVLDMPTVPRPGPGPGPATLEKRFEALQGQAWVK